MCSSPRDVWMGSGIAACCGVWLHLQDSENNQMDGRAELRTENRVRGKIGAEVHRRVTVARGQRADERLAESGCGCSR